MPDDRVRIIVLSRMSALAVALWSGLELPQLANGNLQAYECILLRGELLLSNNSALLLNYDKTCDRQCEQKDKSHQA